MRKAIVLVLMVFFFWGPPLVYEGEAKEAPPRNEHIEIVSIKQLEGHVYVSYRLLKSRWSDSSAIYRHVDDSGVVVYSKAPAGSKKGNAVPAIIVEFYDINKVPIKTERYAVSDSHVNDVHQIIFSFPPFAHSYKVWLEGQ